MSTGKKIFSGIFWTSLQAIVQRSFSFIIKLFLARLLFPEDFGIIGMAVVFTSFIKIFNDLGFGVALIQRKKEDLSEDYFQTAFWTGTIWSVIIYLIIAFVVAPFAGWFYEEEILKSIIPVLSIGVLASPINLVHRAQLTRALDFKRLAIINNSSSIFSGLLALLLAYLGFGVWSLVFNSVAHFIIAMPQYFIATGWKPRLIWKKQHFKDLFGFGVFTTFSGLVSQFASQGDYLLIGKFIGKVELGLYSFAFILTDAIRAQINSVINSVLFPIYSQYQDDKIKQFSIYTKSVFFNSLVIVPIMSILFYDPNFLLFLFGEKWAESLIIIRIISLSVIVQIITASFPSLLRANNLPGLEFKVQLIKVLVFYLPLIFIGVKYYGIIGAAIAVLVSRIIGAIMNLIVLEKWLDLSSVKVLKEFFKGLLPSLIAILICYFLFDLLSLNLIYESFLKLICLATLIFIFTFLINKQELISLHKLYKKRNDK
ncbi:lipopolysaccharide biosynthesis protein [Salegentibacter sp. T436]|mgnify:CR=1 FL=1|uniref:lipopolysaccharide biosynthesis protein n=1 Tax=Salegentibacter sp. T436 TaxID=1729720 RepID=UPI00094A3AC3|nr:lipopolysaccharide biosynthesis protein [Salegentibacter sp. T436]APS39307.1 hypothetical protein AO058_10670 [Salegentibacter sp. T436]|tara:strand:+ start:28 stop:1479 length:1452 start_codon:yes stop_codon:yes gene_type:complete